ncbi:hypothetical protein VTN02DRAFT_4930 [Thermoascus thermophilus]
MAYDGYHNSPGAYEQQDFSGLYPEHNMAHPASYAPPYPPPFLTERLYMPQPTMPPPPPPPLQPFNPTTAPYQEPPRPLPPYQEGINSAVASAFHQADTSNYVPPEVVAQVTAAVIQQLKATGLENLQGQQQSQPAPPSAHQEAHPPSSHPNSRSASASTSAQNVYPPPPRRTPSNQGYRSPPLQTKYPRTSPTPSSAPGGERLGSPASHTSDQAQRDVKPKALSGVSTSSEMTTLERIWGKLFEDGKPTPRLGQFLRGIAVHLIENYAPGNTIVIVPEKMQKFYEDTKVAADPYPWQEIFNHRTSAISKMYREIEAEHHLVQGDLREKPDIPGLTPRGFERWATLMIQAHPEREYERLQRAVLDMPISNPDDKKERFPKEIPRRLFPDIPDFTLREKLEESLTHNCFVKLAPVKEEENPKTRSHNRTVPVDVANASTAGGSTRPTSPHVEREHQPHTAAPTSAVVNEEDETLPARPIERERKPYTAHPGGRKIYEESKPTRHKHTNSVSTATRPKDTLSPPSPFGYRPSASYAQDPVYQRAAAAGTSSGTGLHRSTSTKKSGRKRSSSVGVAGPGSYRHSESDLFAPEKGSSSGYPDLGGFHKGGYQQGSSASDIPGPDSIEDRDRDRDRDGARRYYDFERDLEDGVTYKSLREKERDREREKDRYLDYHQSGGRGNKDWGTGDEDYYRSMFGSQGGSAGGGWRR